ncbi:MAG: class I poly(R)-hydroxyalkanoic acid synthase, partial [Sphingopyxis sp.]|nr:class I poly(R)-hydroxyalkanoic acid synthase [Sphingopyxis sp.]
MSDADKSDTTDVPNPFLPSPDDIQHWASVIGRAQQMMLEYALGQAHDGKTSAPAMFDPSTWLENPATQMWAQQSSKMWDQGVAFWTSLATLNPMTPPAPDTATKDRRFADPDWASNPVFAMIRQTYGLLAEQ